RILLKLDMKRPMPVESIAPTPARSKMNRRVPWAIRLSTRLTIWSPSEPSINLPASVTTTVAGATSLCVISSIEFVPLQVPAVPLQRQAHAFFERKPRPIAQVPGHRRNVGLRMAHIARSWGPVVRGNLHAFQLLQKRPCPVQRDAAAVAAVIDFARHARGARGLQVQLHHILHIGEVARLFSIAQDGGRSPLQNGFDKQRK